MRIVYLQSAQDDLADIYDYIAHDNPDRAAQFIQRLRAAVDRLSVFPERASVYEPAGPDTRKLPVAGYAVFYRIIEGIVVIGRVVHGRRDFGALDLDMDLN